MDELNSKVPVHVAIIMDGNGRWAKARNLPRIEGHRAGTENLRQIIKASVEFGVKFLTIYAFSTENWGRPREEVKGLLNILESVIENELEELHAQGVRICHLGRLEALPVRVQKKVQRSVEVTKNNQNLILNIAWNYGGRDEIVYAIQRIIEEKIAPQDVTEELVGKYLFTCCSPDPDLIIRTSGEMRTSNFLIWQAAYSEWFITPVFWPDFNKEEYKKALDAYSLRKRRFGKLDQ